MFAHKISICSLVYLACARHALNVKVEVRIFNEQLILICSREISKNATRCLSCTSKSHEQTRFNLSKEELQSLLDQGYSRI